MIRIILLCFTLAFALDGTEKEAPPAMAPGKGAGKGKGSGKGSPVMVALMEEVQKEEQTKKHPALDELLVNNMNEAKDGEDLAARIIGADSSKDPVEALDEAADEMEGFIEASKKDPFLKAVLEQVLEFETKPTHPATHAWAIRTAKQQKTYPEKILVLAAMKHKKDILKKLSEDEELDESEGPKAVSDYLESMLVESEKDPLSMAAVDLATKELVNPTHPLMDAKVMAKAKKDGVLPEVEFVKLAHENKGALKNKMDEEGITDLAEGLEAAVGALEAQAAAALAAEMEAEVAMEDYSQAFSQADTYDSYDARPLTAVDYGTYFFAAIGAAFLAGKAFMMLKPVEYAVVEADDSL